MVPVAINLYLLPLFSLIIKQVPDIFFLIVFAILLVIPCFLGASSLGSPETYKTHL